MAAAVAWAEEIGKRTNGQVEIGAGDFSFYVSSGYLIEGGKLTAPIKDVNLIGNGTKALEHVSLVGNDKIVEVAAIFEIAFRLG